MKKIIDYKILLNGDKDLIAFQDEVSREIKIGWQPLGAPFEYDMDLYFYCPSYGKIFWIKDIKKIKGTKYELLDRLRTKALEG